MDVLIHHFKDLEGSVNIPGSKSQTLRALYSAMIAKGVSVIEDPLDSEDTDAMLNVLKLFGVRIKQTGQRLYVFSPGFKNLKPPSYLNIKNSGIALRFIAAFAALFKKNIQISGTEALCKNRSVEDLEKGLRFLEVKVKTKNGYAPIHVRGPARNYACYLKGGDSQPISSILWLLSLIDRRSKLWVSQPKEIPWINLTLYWLFLQKKQVFLSSHRKYVIYGASRIKPFFYKVPKDFSSAAFMVAAGLFQGKEIKIHGLDFLDKQGDKALLFHLKKGGAKIFWNKEELVVKKTQTLDLQEIDCEPIIDALPVLASLSCLAKNKVVIKNGAGARGKESDRIHAMEQNLLAVGLDAKSQKDGLIINSGKILGGVCEGFNDHRIIMATALLGLLSQKPVTIRNAESINKTYPQFFDELKKLGAKVEKLN